MLETSASTPEAATTLLTTRVAGEASQKDEEGTCDMARAGRPIDITIPDDTRLFPGEPFSKTWRLENAGTCTWTRGYSVVWFSGDQLGVTQSQSFSTIVEPEQAIDITVDMIAPKQPGTYQSNWKIRNEEGRLFGIGPNADSPFWVRIVVVPINTPTMTPTAPVSTPTRPPVILVRGSVELLLEEHLDLDLDGEIVDLLFQRSDDGEMTLEALNGAGLALFGPDEPRFEDCLTAEATEAVVTIDEEITDSYFCYRTSENLPGRLFLSHVDFENGQLGLEYTTWVIP